MSQQPTELGQGGSVVPRASPDTCSAPNHNPPSVGMQQPFKRCPVMIQDPGVERKEEQV